MDAARVRDEEGSGVAPGAQRERGVEIGLGVGRPVGRKRAGRGGGEGIEPKGYGGAGRFLRPNARPARRKPAPRCAPPAPISSSKRSPASKRTPFENRVQGRGVERLQAEAVSPDRAGEHDRETIRAAGEIVERLGVGFARVRMVEPGDQPPGSRRSERTGPVSGRVERLDADAVRGPGSEAVEAFALQGRFGGIPPVGFAPGGERPPRRRPRPNSFR